MLYCSASSAVRMDIAARNVTHTCSICCSCHCRAHLSSAPAQNHGLSCKVLLGLGSFAAASLSAAATLCSCCRCLRRFAFCVEVGEGNPQGLFQSLPPVFLYTTRRALLGNTMYVAVESKKALCKACKHSLVLNGCGEDDTSSQTTAAIQCLPGLSQLRLREQDVASDFRIVLDKLQLLWQSSWVFALDVKEAGPGCAQ